MVLILINHFRQFILKCPTKFIEQSPSWEKNSGSVRVHYHNHNNPSLQSILININQIYTYILFFRITYRRVPKLRKAIINLVMTVRLSVCPPGTTLFLLDGFSWNFIFEYFSKIISENSGYIKIEQK
jgi:hypothetical protein